MAGRTEAHHLGPRVVSASPESVLVHGHRLEVQYLRVPGAQGTIVLLHEALGSVSHWRDFPQRLADRCAMDVLVYSRQGHGNSDGAPMERSRSYFEQQALVVLPALLAHVSIANPVLMGHSEGAAIALIYTTLGDEAKQSPVRALVLESPILLLEPAAAEGMALAERAWKETDLRARLSRHHRDADAVFAAWLSIRESDSMLSLPLESRLPVVHCPVLMLQGERDEYATVRQAEALRPVAPQMRLIRMPASGHTPHREEPEVVLAEIAGFLSTVI